MRTILGTIVGLFIIIGLPILLIIGLIKPTLLLPKKVNTKRPRLVIIVTTIVTFIVGLILFGILNPDFSSSSGNTKEEVVLNDSIIASSYSQQFEDIYKTFVSSNSSNQNGMGLFNDLDRVLKDWKEAMDSFDPSRESTPLSSAAYEKAALQFVALSDSILSSSYTQKVDALLNQLDSQTQQSQSRGEIIREIEDLLFNKWWNAISIDDSLVPELPLSQKAYYDAQKRFDGPYARYCIYGDEITSDVEFWAKIRAEEVLKKVCVDPKSLVIEESICEGKTQKGYKCKVIYRAKNGFGGYVRESVSLIMAYDIDSKVYRCIEIH